MQPAAAGDVVAQRLQDEVRKVMRENDDLKAEVIARSKVPGSQSNQQTIPLQRQIARLQRQLEVGS